MKEEGHELQEITQSGVEVIAVVEAEGDSPKNEENEDDPVNTFLVERTVTGNLENGVPLSAYVSDRSDSLVSQSTL